MTEPVLAGVAESDLSETPDRNWLENAAIATTRVLNDAGCTLNGLNGVAIASGNDYMSAMLLSEYLGLDHPSILAGTEIGGSSFEAFCGDVAAHMALSDIDVVAVAYGSTSKTDPGRDRSCKLTNPTERFVRPTGLFTPSGAYAMACR